MKITLIQPAKPNDDSPAGKSWSLCKPMSLLYLLAALEKKSSHSPSIIDFEQIFALDPNAEVRSILEKDQADIYGVTATTFTRFEAINIINLLREVHPKKPIIVGGVHFMYADIDTMQNVPAVDFVIRGEGEITLIRLLDALEYGIDLSTVRGLTYRKNGMIERTEDQDVFEDLDSVPIFEYKSPVEYPEFLMGPNVEIPAVSIMSSRGCPNNCVFCAKAGMKYRHHSTEYVIKEIKHYITNYNIRAFNFLDLTFTANPRKAKELCEAIVKEKLDIQWWCETRANIPLSLLNLMYKAGCRYLVMGVESGSERVLKNLQKGISKAQVNAVIERATSIGIDLTCYFMYSHLTEKFVDAVETIKYMDMLKKKFNIHCAFQPCLILPGTKIEKIAIMKGLLPTDFSWSKQYQDLRNSEIEQLTGIPLFLMPWIFVK